MTEQNWLFDCHEVVENAAGEWWHIIARWQSVDCDNRKYELADATHTEYKTLHAGDVEGLPSEDPMFESCGWDTNTKPAAERGFRVNGVLCGPSKIDYWRGNACSHDATCPHCESDGREDIDIIHDIKSREVQSSHYICRECGEQWSEDYE